MKRRSVPRLRRRGRFGRFGQDAGSELIEFALVFPMLLFISLGIVDFGFLFQRYEVVTNASREGARVAALPGYSAADVQNRVAAYVQAGGLPTTGGNPAITVTPTTITAASGSWPATQVDVFYNHDYMFIDALAGWFGGNFSSITLQARTTMRDEIAGGGGS